MSETATPVVEPLVVEPVVTPPVAPVVEPPVEGEEALGDPGKKALDAMKAERNAAREEARIAKEALAQSKPDETALEAARREATEAATTVANDRVKRSELKAAATGKLADPADALAFIDLSKIEVDQNGDVDSGALNTAIADLLTRKPHLAVSAPLFQGGGDGGAGAPPRPPSSIDEQIAAARAAKDWRAEIALQNQKMPETPGLNLQP